MPIDEAGARHDLLSEVEIFPPQEDVDALREPNRGLVHGADPFRDRVAADDSIDDLASFEGGGRANQTIADFLNCVSHALPT